MDNNIIDLQIEYKKIEEGINILKKRKQELTNKIKLQKMEKKKNNKNGGKVNQLIRVSKNFNDEIIDILNKRIEYGRDESLTSKPKITELIVKHNFWGDVKEDLINFNFEEKIKC